MLKISQQLKFLKRTGWTRYPEIKSVESVADHSYFASIIALTLDSSKLPIGFKKDLCIKILLLHDLAEVVVGDITPYDNINEINKHQMEDKAFHDIVSTLPEESR